MIITGTINGKPAVFNSETRKVCLFDVSQGWRIIVGQHGITDVVNVATGDSLIRWRDLCASDKGMRFASVNIP
jgi:hypothetical protein